MSMSTFPYKVLAFFLNDNRYNGILVAISLQRSKVSNIVKSKMTSNADEEYELSYCFPFIQTLVWLFLM